MSWKIYFRVLIECYDIKLEGTGLWHQEFGHPSFKDSMAP